MRRGLLLLPLALALALPASAQATFPGQNGKIAFSSYRDDSSGCHPFCNFEIYTINPDGTDLTRLTNDSPSDVAQDTDPKWSPDGTKILFARSTNSATGGYYVMNADGSGKTLLPPSLFASEVPSWSSDGQKIVFIRSETQLWTSNLDGSNQTLLGSYTGPGCAACRPVSEPRWAPDGQKIAFTVDGLDGGDIATINSDGTGFVDHTPGGTFTQDPDWSPDASKIVFSGDLLSPTGNTGLIVMNRDGSGQTRLTNDALNPSWAPDGSKMAFNGGSGIVVMNSDSSGRTTILNDSKADFYSLDWQSLPNAGPQADLIASIQDSPDPIPVGGRLHYVAFAKNLVGPSNATGVTLTVTLDPNAFFVSATPTQGSCSHASNVVICNFGTVPNGTSADVDIAIEPRFPTSISASASVSSSSSDPNSSNNSASTTTTITSGGQPRPKGATPLRASLAIAYKSCGAGEENEQHGGPLNVPSCSPPTQSSSYLTVGTLDANGQAAGFMGSVRFDVIEGDTNPNNGDQADVALHASLTDVRNKPSLTDYTGELEGQTTLRITDHDNSAGYFAAATVQDMPLNYTIPCTATGGAAGSTCALNTTVDALTGGGVKELKRAIWQLDRVRVTDGGADGIASTQPNTMFATQGVFVP